MEKGDFGGKKGFTIIEVALVLAIAGLIFMMVFIALPALQRTQRDSRRRDDIMLFIEAVKKYQTNNRGALPNNNPNPTGNATVTVTSSSTGGDTTWAGFYQKYLGDKLVDPAGDNYKLQVMTCNTTTTDADCPNGALSSANLYGAAFPNGYTIKVVLQATCSGDKAVRSSNPRNLAALYRLEGAGVYCNNT